MASVDVCPDCICHAGRKPEVGIVIEGDLLGPLVAGGVEVAVSRDQRAEFRPLLPESSDIDM